MKRFVLLPIALLLAGCTTEASKAALPVGELPSPNAPVKDATQAIQIAKLACKPKPGKTFTRHLQSLFLLSWTAQLSDGRWTVWQGSDHREYPDCHNFSVHVDAATGMTDGCKECVVID